MINICKKPWWQLKSKIIAEMARILKHLAEVGPRKSENDIVQQLVYNLFFTKIFTKFISHWKSDINRPVDREEPRHG